MAGKKIYNLDVDIKGKAIVYTVPNGTGTVLTYNPTTKEISTRTNAEFISDMNLMTTNNGQNITGKKRFYTTGSTYTDNALIAFSSDGSWPAMSFYRNVDSAGQIVFYGTYFGMQNDQGNGFINVKAAGFAKDGSDNSYILLGGGGHKPVSEFVAPYQLDNYWKIYEVAGYMGVNASSPFAFLNGGEAEKVYMGGLLISNAYADSVNIPPYGAYILGLISTANNGNSAQWKQAYTWGNHADAGYATQTWVSDRYISKAIIFENNFNTISGNISGIYRADNFNGAGVKSIYSPMLHLGGYDTMSQLQIQYANGNDAITGELSYRGGFNNTWGVWRTAWDNVNFNPDLKLNQSGASYRLNWDGATDNLYRDNILLGYLLNSSNILGFGFVTQTNLNNQLNNYIPLVGTGDFTGSITNPDNTIQFGNDNYFKAKINLSDFNNTNYPGWGFQISGNIEEGFSVYSNGNNQTSNFSSYWGGIFMSFSNGGSSNSFNFTADGLYADYKVPLFDGSFIQRKFLADNYVNQSNYNPNNFVNITSMQVVGGNKEFTSPILASGGISSSSGSNTEVFVGDGSTANMEFEIVNEANNIRLMPVELNVPSNGFLEVSNSNRLIRIFGEEIKQTVNLKDVFPRQEYIIYNLDPEENNMTVQINGATVGGVNYGFYITIYIRDNLSHVIHARAQFFT